MTTMSKRFLTVGDVLRAWDDIPWAAPTWHTSFTGNVYDPEKYDLVPKKDYIDKEIKRVEEDIATLERNKKMAIDSYDTRIESLRTEKERLQGQKRLKGG